MLSEAAILSLDALATIAPIWPIYSEPQYREPANPCAFLLQDEVSALNASDYVATTNLSRASAGAEGDHRHLADLRRVATMVGLVAVS